MKSMKAMLGEFFFLRLRFVVFVDENSKSKPYWYLNYCNRLNDINSNLINIYII